MADDYRFMTHEHDTSVEVDNIEDYLYHEIIHRDEEYREEYIVAELRRKDVSILIEYPRKNSKWHEEKYELEQHEEHKNSMTTVYLVICRHNDKLGDTTRGQLLWFQKKDYQSNRDNIDTESEEYCEY